MGHRKLLFQDNKKTEEKQWISNPRQFSMQIFIMTKMNWIESIVNLELTLSLCSSLGKTEPVLFRIIAKASLTTFLL